MTQAVRSTSPVRLLIVAPVVAVEPTATLRQAARLLADEDVGTAAVLGPVGLDGVLSERDIVRAIAAGHHPDSTSVDGVMVNNPWSVHAETPIGEVADLMLRAGIRHVPVLAGGDVLGMVSIRDVLEVVRNDQRRGPRGDSGVSASDEGSWPVVGMFGPTPPALSEGDDVTREE